MKLFHVENDTEGLDLFVPAKGHNKCRKLLRDEIFPELGLDPAEAFDEDFTHVVEVKSGYALVRSIVKVDI